MAMTTQDLCKSTGLTPRKVEYWIERGTIEPMRAGVVVRRQVERVRLFRALQSKAVARPAGRQPLPDERFVIFHGRALHGCCAAAAIAAVVRAKRWCSAVDLAAVRSTLAWNVTENGT